MLKLVAIYAAQVPTSRFISVKNTTPGAVIAIFSKRPVPGADPIVTDNTGPKIFVQ